MKIAFDRRSLSNVIPPLMGTLGSKTTMPSMEGILIEALPEGVCIFTTYDSEKGMKTEFQCKVYEPGKCVINANKLLQTVRVMDGDEIELTVDEKMTAKFSCGKSTHRMMALPAEDFPQIPDIVRNRGFVITQSVLKRMINKTSYAMGIDDPRQILNGTYFRVVPGEITLVSCDSFKLAKCKKCIEMGDLSDENHVFDHSFIVPIKTINELLKLLNDSDEDTVTVYVSRRFIIFILNGYTFFSRLVDGEYIDYDRIILSNHKISVILPREELLSALERAALITEEKIIGSVRSHVKLEFVDKVLKISAVSTAGSTYDEIDVDQTGDNILIAFNNRYLMDSVRACSGDEVKLTLSSPLTSMNIEPIISSDDMDEIYMLLPIRMK